MHQAPIWSASLGRAQPPPQPPSNCCAVSVSACDFMQPGISSSTEGRVPGGNRLTFFAKETPSVVVWRTRNVQHRRDRRVTLGRLPTPLQRFNNCLAFARQPSLSVCKPLASNIPVEFRAPSRQRRSRLATRPAEGKRLSRRSDEVPPDGDRSHASEPLAWRGFLKGAELRPLPTVPPCRSDPPP